MKTVSLLRLLNDKEKLTLLNQLKQEKKPRLQKALSLFIKESEPTKEELYKAIFGVKYTSSKDVNLRNELRLLNEEIEGFIVCRDVNLEDNKYFKSRILLNRYNKNEANDLFEIEWKSLISSLDKNEDQLRFYDVLLSWYFYAMKITSNKNGAYLSNFKFWKSYKDSVIDSSLYIYLNYCQKYNYLARLIKYFSPDLLEKDSFKVKPIEPIELHYQLRLSSLSKENRYLQLQVQAADYTKSTEEIVSLLLESLQFKDKSDIVPIIGVYQTISTLYSYDDDKLEQSHHYILKAYELLTPDMFTTFDFVTVTSSVLDSYLCLGLFEEGIEFFKKHNDYFRKFYTDYHKINTLMMLAYLYVDEVDIAYQMIPNDFTNYNRWDMYSFKVVYTMIMIKRGEFDMAKREIENSLKSLKLNPLEDDHYVNLNKALKKCIQYKSNSHSKEDILRLVNLEQTENDLFKRYFHLYIDNLI